MEISLRFLFLIVNCEYLVEPNKTGQPETVTIFTQARNDQNVALPLHSNSLVQSYPYVTTLKQLVQRDKHDVL